MTNQHKNKADPLEDPESLRKDAERYRWLKSRKGLSLKTEHPGSIWRRGDGTKFTASHYLAEGDVQHAPEESLDKTIDKAIIARRLIDES